MTERIILSCRMTGGELEPGRVAGARALIKSGEAHGAVLVASTASSLSFAWDADSLDDAVLLAVLAATPAEGEKTRHAWASAIAVGEMDALSPEATSSALAWGPPLVAATELARIARAGEVLLDASTETVRPGELMKSGGRRGRIAGAVVRGARLDVRQPWKREAALSVAKMTVPPFVRGAGIVESLLGSPGTVAIVRADPGLGGTRLLEEVASRCEASLWIAPSGLGVEPLGALRRALARKRALLHVPGAIEPLLAALLRGEGTTLDAAASLVALVLADPSHEGSRALLLDDVVDVDGVTLEACVRALSRVAKPFVVVARLDATAVLPGPLEAIPVGLEVERKPFGVKDAEALASTATKGALTPEACARWARRGGYSPLGIVEAIACGLATGELLWADGSAFPRRQMSGKGRARATSFWITRRAEELSAEGRAVVTALALLGGDASRETLEQVLAAVGAHVDVALVARELEGVRWVRSQDDGALTLPSRSHRDAVLELLPDTRVRAWHRAVGQTLEKAGPLERAEAAYHAAGAGDGPWAARLAIVAARAASDSRLEGSALRLLAFARKEDPSCEEEARRAVASSTAHAEEAADVEPTTIASAPGETRGPESARLPSSRAPRSRRSSRPVPGEAGQDVALRLTELSRDALLDGDTGALERWCNGLSAAGGHDGLAERMRAMADLSRGQVAHAVRVLTSAHEKLVDAGAPPGARCQASLVLGVALAHGGNVDDALIRGLDALARAKEANDQGGERACLTFLAKLFEGVSREALATRIRERVTELGA